jgi:hypothetical protein
MLDSAKAMAMTAVDLALRPEVLEKAMREFDRSLTEFVSKN